ncbi:MAG: helix-turn-helix domain-containing protein [Pirellulales bacterium]|nr:helix-turn-helix domain-containing protein [Pirellulales bacterium]
MAKRRGVITKRGTAAIAGRIAETRKDRGISQQQMAKKLGVTQPIISRYERRELRIHAELLVKIAKILKVTAAKLLGLRPIAKQNKIADELDTPSKRRMWKKFQQVAKWPEKDQRAVI